MADPLRRVAAAVVAVALIALVACDIEIAGFRAWWDRHSLSASVVSSLLVLAVTGLIVDEVVARRQRRTRAVSVAVQGLIVYGQARRAYDATTTEDDTGQGTVSASEELRALASMVLTAAPNLFDDHEARRFLEEVERLTGLLIRAVSVSSHGASSQESRERLASGMAQVKVTVEPLVARIPTQERSALEGPPPG